MAYSLRGSYYILSGLLFSFFYTWSSVFSLISPWLNQYLGLNATQTGIVFSIVAITALCTQPVYGFVQDRLGLRKNLLWMIGLLLVASGPSFIFIVTPLFHYHVTAGSIVLGIYIGATFNSGIGALESYTERVSRISAFEYGSARLWGSLGWAAATFFAGRFINIDPRLNFWMASVSAMVFIVLLWQLRAIKGCSATQQATESTPALADALSLLAMPAFWSLVVFVCGISIYNVYDQQFSVYFISFFSSTAKGNEMYGYLNSFQVLLEAGAMFLAPFLVNRIGAKNGLIISGFIMSGRILGSYLAADALTISMMKILHAVELPILLIAMFKYITRQFDPRLSATLYLVAFQFIVSLSTSLLSWAAGISYDLLGFEKTYLIMGNTVMVLTIISVFLLRGEARDTQNLSLSTR